MTINRDKFGKVVRDAWVERKRLWLLTNTVEASEGNRKAAELNRTWEQLSEFERETDRQIADAILQTAKVDIDRLLGLSIKELVEQAHGTAKAKGWWEDVDRNVPEQIALMHSELSEALEEYRAGRSINCTWQEEEGSKPEGFGIELADCIIRIADICGRYGIDLEGCLRTKLAYNLSRPHRHGGKKA